MIWFRSFLSFLYIQQIWDVQTVFFAERRKSIHLPSFPTVLLRRILFLRKHHPMDLSSFLSGFPLSFLFIFCTDCTVMSALRSPLHSLVLSPDLQSVSWITGPFETYLSIPFLYYLIDAMIRKRTVPSWFPSCIFPVSNSDCVGFLFVRCIQS